MRVKHYVTAAVVITAVIATATTYFSDNAEGPQVVATTSVLSSIVEDIGGDEIESATLVPAGSCPGHFDVKIEHLRQIEKSGTLLAHGFESYLPNIQNSLSNSSFRPAIIELESSWLTREGIAGLYKKVAEQLTESFPEKENTINRRLNRSLLLIEETHQEVQSIISRKEFAGRKIICNSHLEGYLNYLQFDVIRTYGRREDLSAGEIRDIIRASHEHGVELVIDNMQADSDSGKVFAEELETPHVAVSNFPGVLPGAETLYETLLANTRLIENKLD